MVKFFKVIMQIILWICSIAYPFLMYYFLKNEQGYLALLVLLGLLVLRLLTSNKNRLKESFLFLIIGGICAILYLVKQNASGEVFLLLYPVIVNISLLILFGTTLFKEISFIEKIASFKVPVEQRTPFFKKYCRRVTFAWCLFFILNGTIALVTAVWCSKEIWTIYNGFIAYILIGLMFTIEFIIRSYLQSKNNKIEKNNCNNND